MASVPFCSGLPRLEYFGALAMELFLYPFKILEVVQPTDVVGWKLVERIVIDERNISGAEV